MTRCRSIRVSVYSPCSSNRFGRLVGFCVLESLLFLITMIEPISTCSDPWSLLQFWAVIAVVDDSKCLLCAALLCSALLCSALLCRRNMDDPSVCVFGSFHFVLMIVLAS